MGAPTVHLLGGSWSGQRQKLVLAVLVVALLGALLTDGRRPAAAAPGDAQPVLDQKTVNVSEAEGGDLVTFTITATCSNLGDDDCSGAEFSDPLPTFTDVYGNEVPVELVSASGPSAIWGSPAFTLDTSDPAAPTVVGTAGDWPAGTSSVIVITVRIPEGTVPEGTQTLENTATVTDPVDAPDYRDDSTTATTTISGTGPAWEVTKLGPGDELRLDREYTWVISVCTDDPASALWPIYDISDVLPAGFEYHSSDPAGTYVDDGVPPDSTSDGAGEVVWTFDADDPPPIGDDGCFRMSVTGSFPSDDARNTEGAVKTDTASGTGRDTPDGDGTDLGEDTATGTIVGPTFGGISTTKRITDLDGADDYFVADGDVIRFGFGLAVDSDFPLDSVVLDDGRWDFDDGSTTDSGTGVPESFTPTTIDPGTWNDPVRATIQGSDDGTTWTDIATGVPSGAAPIDLASPFRSVRWVWGPPLLGTIRGDFAASGQAITGVVGETVDDFGRYTNRTDVTVSPVGAPPAQASAFDDYVLETPLPHPGVTKTASDDQRQPGQDLTYRIVVDNDADATGDLVEPVLRDCVPASIVVQGPVDAPAPWIAGPDLTCAPGETPVSLRFDGTLAPGEATPPVTVEAVVSGPDPGPVAEYGTYTNTAFVEPGGGGSFAHCQNVDPSCGSEAPVVVVPTAQLDSRKCVAGELDLGVFRPTPACTEGEPDVVPAQTLPAGTIDWRLELENVGNTDVTDVDFVDLLPGVGDTAVITTADGALVPRNSEFSPVLITPIVAPAGWTVSYSTSANPCRPEVGGPSAGCDDPAWTTTPDLLALGSYRALKFSYAGDLDRGGSASFAWRMRAPIADPSYDRDGTDADDDYEFLADCDAFADASDPGHCPRAVNSFAYGAASTNLPDGAPQIGRLYAEPPSVEVRVVRRPMPNAIGDRVWFDEDFDGIQDDGEEGVPAVSVALFTADGTFVAETSTDAEGAYGFSSVDGLPIPPGDYVVRFYPQEGWVPSPQDVTGGPADEGTPGASPPGTNTDDDSDIPRTVSGIGAAGPYHQTVVVELGNNLNNPPGPVPEGELDPTWDAGLWRADPAVRIDKVTKDAGWDDSEAGDGVLIVPGRPVEWTYTVTNTGNARLEDVVVVDDGGPGDGFDVTACEIVDDGENAFSEPSSAVAPIALNRGAAMTCTATGTAGAVDYANVATVTGTAVTDDGDPVVAPAGLPPIPDPVTDDDPSSYVAATYDLALAKTVGPADPSTGEVTFTVTIANQGRLPSGSFTVTDALTPGLTVVSTTPAPSSSSGDSTTGIDLEWELADLGPGATRTLTIEARATDFMARPFRNLAEISDDGADQVRTGDDVLTPTSDVDSTPNTVPDDDGDYGPVGSPSAIDNQGIVDAGIGPDAPPAGEDDADIADVNVPPTYDLALAVVADADVVEPGDTLGYTVTVQNQGTVPSAGATVTDRVPPGLAVVPGSVVAGGAVAGDPVGGQTVTWAVGPLAPGATTDLTFDVTIVDVALRPFRNQAEVSADTSDAWSVPGDPITDADSTPDADPGNDGDYGPVGTPGAIDNDDIAEAGVGPDAPPAGEDDADIADVDVDVRFDLALVKSVEDVVVAPGADDLFTITVQNQGNVASGPYTITDDVPAGLGVVAGSVSDGGVVSDLPLGPASTVTWTDLPSIEPGATATVSFRVTIDDEGDGRPYENFAEITADAAASLSSATEEIADVDSVPGDAATSGVNSITIDGAGVGRDAGFDDEDVATILAPIAYDLALVKTVSSPSIESDGTATFTITVANQGNVPSRAYEVTDLVPDGLRVVAGSVSDGGVVDGDGRVVTWTDLPSIEAGATDVLTFDVRVDDMTSRPWTNVAEITADSAGSYTRLDEFPVTDEDSVPGDEETSDVDVTDVDQAGAGDDAGFDDEDVAVLDATVTPDPETPTDVGADDIGTPGSDAGSLPRTGSDPGPPTLAAIVLLGAGTVLLLLGRHARRRAALRVRSRSTGTDIVDG